MANQRTTQAPETTGDLSAATAIAPVRKAIEVNRSPADAYAFFTRQFSRWWPAETHSVGAMQKDAGPVRVVLEAWAGGRIFEADTNGKETDWGRVKIAEPGVRLVMSWHPGRPPEEATEVEFRFVASGPSSCRVELEHRNWHRIAESAQAVRDNYDGGWDGVLERLSSAYQSG